MTGTHERLTRAALALLMVATGKRTDADYVAAVVAELRVVARLLEEREWLKALPGEKPEDAA